MNWRRGLFRLWIVGAALFLIAVASISYDGMKAEFDAVASKPPEAGPSVLAEFRRWYPQYNDLSNAQLADALYKKFQFCHNNRENADIFGTAIEGC